MVHQRIPYTCARNKIGAAADCIDACHQKITPQLRRKTMQWLRRRSEPCELRGALFLAASSAIRKKSTGPARGLSGCGISNRIRNEMARSFVYLCAPLCPGAPLLRATWWAGARTGWRSWPFYDLASYGIERGKRVNIFLHSCPEISTHYRTHANKPRNVGSRIIAPKSQPSTGHMRTNHET